MDLHVDWAIWPAVLSLFALVWYASRLVTKLETVKVDVHDLKSEVMGNPKKGILSIRSIQFNKGVVMEDMAGSVAEHSATCLNTHNETKSELSIHDHLLDELTKS